MRHYFRRRRARMKNVPLPGLPGSAEFMAAHGKALSLSPPDAETIESVRAKRILLAAVAHGP
jgi:hypothetical protein